MAAAAPGAASAKPGKPRPGTLDRSFSGDGKLVGAATGGPTVRLALGPDGEIAVVRGSTVAEYLPNGRPRREFGRNGRIVVPAPAGQAFTAAAIAFDGLGRLLVAGNAAGESMRSQSPSTTYQRTLTASTVEVARFLGDGERDRSFGVSGIFDSELGFPLPTALLDTYPSYPPQYYTFPKGSVTVSGMTIDGQDRPVLTGSAVETVGPDIESGGQCTLKKSLVARLDQGGSLDPAFNGSGVVTDPGSERAEMPAIDSSGDVAYTVGAGTCTRPFQADAAILLRTGGGPLESGFGSSGRVGLPLPDFNAEVPRMTIDPSGRILIGWMIPLGYGGFQLQRFLPDGRADQSLGTVRIVLEKWAEVESLTSDSQGRPLLLGRAASGSRTTSFRLERRTVRGKPDRHFGRGGVALTGFGAGKAVRGEAVLVDRRGRILVAGSLRNRRRTEFAIVRYNGG